MRLHFSITPKQVVSCFITVYVALFPTESPWNISQRSTASQMISPRFSGCPGWFDASSSRRSESLWLLWSWKWNLRGNGTAGNERAAWRIATVPATKPVMMTVMATGWFITPATKVNKYHKQIRLWTNYNCETGYCWRLRRSSFPDLSWRIKAIYPSVYHEI